MSDQFLQPNRNPPYPSMGAIPTKAKPDQLNIAVNGQNGSRHLQNGVLQIGNTNKIGSQVGSATQGRAPALTRQIGKREAGTTTTVDATTTTTTQHGTGKPVQPI